MDSGEQEAGEEEGRQAKTGRGAPVQGSDEKCGGGEEDRHCVTFFYQSSKHVFFGSKKHSGMFFQIVQQPKDSVTALKSLIVPILTKHTKVE